MKHDRKRRQTRKSHSSTFAVGLVATVGVILLAAAVTWLSRLSVAVEDADIVVYKRPNCMCCHEWVTHLEESGLLVSVVNVWDILNWRVLLLIFGFCAHCHHVLV